MAVVRKSVSLNASALIPQAELAKIFAEGARKLRDDAISAGAAQAGGPAPPGDQRVVASGGSSSMLRLVIGTGLGTGTASSRTGVCQAARLALHRRVDWHRPAISVWWRPAGRCPCCGW